MYLLNELLRSQGGLLWSLKPEALLDYKDFLMWCSENTSTYSNLPEEFFDIISKQSWTHLLMQIIKVYSFILTRVFVSAVAHTGFGVANC